jgi:hypothetical protein
VRHFTPDLPNGHGRRLSFYSIGTPEVAHLVSNMSAIYSPELSVGYTAACCSDHQVSFIISCMRKRKLTRVALL